jgi:putative oxidoreductase
MRISLGVMFLAHSIVLKIVTLGMPGTMHYLTSLGLPGWFAYPIIAAEIMSGLLLILGVKTFWVASADIPLLAGTIVVEHGHHGWFFASPGGGWEYPAFLIVTCVSVALSEGGSLVPRANDPAA